MTLTSRPTKRLRSSTRLSKAHTATRSDPPADAINDLAARWIASLPDKATVFAPVGVWPVLAILADAATEDVSADLRTALCVDRSVEDADLLHAALDTLKFLACNDALDAAVAVWVSQHLGVREEWLARLPEHSRGLLTQTPAVDQPNLDEWARQHTRDLFTEFPAKIEKEDDFVLASAIGLNMEWTTHFQRISKHKLRQHFRGLSYIRCADGITTVRVEGRSRNQPRSGAINCYLVLGEKGASASDTLSRGLALVRRHGASSISYKNALKLAGPGLTVRIEESCVFQDKGRPYVEITTPGFKVSADHDLLESDVIGLGSAKEEPETLGHHFPGITDNATWVKAAGQSAVARFSSGGFRAAAVTHARGSTCMAAPRKPSPPKFAQALFLDVEIDRAFGFICVEENTGVVLFVGWVTEEQFMDSEKDIRSSTGSK